MKITKIENASAYDLAWSINAAIKESRFTALVESVSCNTVVNISRVRLNKSKDYCGNHAKACERPGKKEKKHTFLEGADWVEFNDLINQVCDDRKVSAFVASARGAGCIIRKGNKRRMQYDADTFIGEKGNGEWRWNYDAPDNHFVSWINSEIPVAPSRFPKGTPGIYSRTNYSCIG